MHGWTVSKLYLLPQTLGPDQVIRVEYLHVDRPTAPLHIAITLDPYLVLNNVTVSMVASQINSHFDDAMRNWNATNAQQARERQEQRSQALRDNAIRHRGEEPVRQVEERVDRWGSTSTLTVTRNARPGLYNYTIEDRPQRTMSTVGVNTNWFTNNSNATTGTYYSIGGGGRGGSSANTPFTFVNSDPVEPILSREDIVQLIKTELTSKLELKLTLDESDGEVTAEVELFLDGILVGSDRDSVQVGY